MGAALWALALLAQQPAPISLRDAVARATSDAAPVALAALRTQAAHERERQARAAWLPTVNATAGWLNRSFNRASLGFSFPTAPGQPAPPDLIGPFDNVDARLRVTQAVFDWTATARTRAARARRLSTAADAAVTAEAVAHSTALAYVRAARAAAVVGARTADSVLAADLARLTAAQVAAGVAPAIDGTRARTQLVAAREAVIVAQAERAHAALELGRVLSLDPSAAPQPADTLGPDLAQPGVPLDAAVATALALATRPDLAAEQARGVAAARAAAAVAAERLPRLDLALDWGANGPAVSDAIATGQIGVQVRWPLFDGLRREARLAEQRVAERESRVRQQDGERQVRADVAAALLDLRATDAQAAIAQERVRLGETEVSQARERFAAGVAGHLEVITAQLGLIDARDALITARAASALARVALARATGTASRLR